MNKNARIILARGLTFLCVMTAWIFFRAADAPTALGILRSLMTLTDLDNLSLFRAFLSHDSPLRQVFDAQRANLASLWIFLCFVTCWFFPNSVEIMRRGKPCISGIRAMPLAKDTLSLRLSWTPHILWGLAAGGALGICLVKVLYEPSQVFLYFQF